MDKRNYRLYLGLWLALVIPICPLNAISKDKIRSVLGYMSKAVAQEDFGRLPKGFSLISGKKFKGVKLQSGMLTIRIDTWSSSDGLLDRYKKAKKEGYNIIAAINGTFYSSRGALGSVVVKRKLPTNIRQIPGSLSRSFLASFRDAEDKQKWFLGETSLRNRDLITDRLKKEGWFNVNKIYGWLENLLGGGGWILRGGKDVHNESYIRQRFRFRKEDRKSRHTVIAQDRDRNLYLIVFEAGYDLHQIARILVKNHKFSKVRDAIFLDGGSSSALVVKGKYYVPPLYLIDSARFTCIQVIVPEIQPIL